MDNAGQEPTPAPQVPTQTPPASYNSKFFLVYGGYIIIFVICIVYLTNVQYAISSGNYDSYLLNPLLIYSMVPLLMVAIICNFLAHYILAKGKGYSGWLTLLALLNIVGIIILLILPNKNKVKHTK